MIKRLPNDGSTKAYVITGIYIVAILIFIIYVIVANNNSPGTTKSSSTQVASSGTGAPSNNPYAVLSPATVAPKTAECQQALSYASDGNPSPYQCSNGDLNAAAWSALSGLELKIMSLGYSASESTAQATICRDIGTNAGSDIETTAYKISALYYGWNFVGALSVDAC